MDQGSKTFFAILVVFVRVSITVHNHHTERVGLIVTLIRRW